MDFWSRLIGGIGNSTATKQAPYKTSEQRLGRFRRAYDQLQTVLKNKKLSIDSVATENALIYLESLKHILQEEIQSPAPHLCIAHAAKSRVYNTVTNVALSSCNDQVIREGLDFFNTLIDSEEGEFLEDDEFANALTTFVDRISSSGSIVASVQTEAAIVVILFGIAAKLRLQPNILPVWFRPHIQESRHLCEPSPSGASASKSGKIEFPLFYFLLDYVHHDRRVGDFARTGLLYIIESAVHTEELERWIVESDLATLMASGLGALYSQLSRKLVLSFTNNSIPAVVAFSEVSHSRPTYDAIETCSAEFQAHLGTFLSYFMFWQDVLEHCTSNDVKQSLLDHFQILFLRQLLYPSLVESSDRDGGSSVAVLTYLRCILESINHPDIVRLVLQYLLALPEPPTEDFSISRPTTLLRRRKSQVLIARLAKGEEKPSPDLFTLVDLILTSLRSRNQQTATSALRLCSAIIRTQHQYAVSTLIRVQAANSQRTWGAHNVDVVMLLSMAKDIATEHGLEESYEAHMQDVRNLLELHSCSTRLLSLPGFANFTNQTLPAQFSSDSKSLTSHTIAVEDPLLKHLLSLLDRFLVNDIETNLSLTQTFTTLASCGYTRLEGWLLGSGNDDEYQTEKGMPSDDELDENRHTRKSSNAASKKQKAKRHALKQARREPIRHPSTASPVFAALNSLTQQIESFRQKIQDFDTYLAERKHIFKIGEEIESALSEPPIRVQRHENLKKSAPATPQNQIQPTNIMGTISRRLFSEENSSPTDASRSSSPRGRQQRDSSASTPVGRLNHLRISPSPQPGARNYSYSPLRAKNPPPTPPSRIITPMGPPDVLLQKIKTATPPSRLIPPSLSHQSPSSGGSETSSVRSESIAEPPATDEVREVSLGHLLTNVVILQEFLLELAALVEVRATLFEDEVKFI